MMHRNIKDYKRCLRFTLLHTACCVMAIFLPSFLFAQSLTPILQTPQKIISRSYKYGSGTGFFISNSLVVTNAHVVEGCLSIHVRGAVKPTRVQLRAVSQEMDLALLASPRAPVRVATLKSVVRAKPNDGVTVIGYPLSHGVSGSYLVKQAAVVDASPSKPYLLLTDVAQRGNSGGPVLDGSGNVIGVVRGMLENINYLENSSTGERRVLNKSRTSLAINMVSLRKFLDANHVTYFINDNNGSYPANWVENVAKDFIVNVHCITDVKEE